MPYSLEQLSITHNITDNKQYSVHLHVIIIQGHINTKKTTNNVFIK